jgi:hypothetical protein
VYFKQKGIILIESTQVRRFLRWSGGGGWSLSLEAKCPKTSQGTIRSVHSDQIVLMMARREARLHKGRPTQGLCSLKTKPTGLQTLKWELENNSRQPRVLTKNRQSDSLKWESTYSFSRGLWRGELLLMMMVMSENQSSWSQVHAKAFLGTDESLLRTQFR